MVTALAGTHRVDVEECPLAAIDRILDAFAARARSNQRTPGDDEKLFSLLADTIVRHLDLDGEASGKRPADFIFGHQLSQRDRRFVVACMVRLLFADPDVLRDLKLAGKVAALLDDVLAPTVYPLINITARNQTFIKERELRGLFASVLDQVQNTIASLRSLATLSTSRTDIMRTFNTQGAKAFLRPFIPDSFERLLNRVFVVAEAYLSAKQSEQSQIMEAVRAVREAVQDLNRMIEQECGAIYCHQFIQIPAATILDLVEQDFRESPFGKPANITVRATDKKYPLATVGARFVLNLEVENSGPGYASEVVLAVEDADLVLDIRQRSLWEMQPGVHLVSYPATVATPAAMAMICVAFQWTNLDGTSSQGEAYIEIESQRRDIPWENLAQENPYDLEPVTTENQLVGRRDILNKLLSYIRSTSMGSAYIYGQKRVGKTSVVKTLQTYLRNEPDPNILVIYLEGGSYTDPVAPKVITALGKLLSRRIRSFGPPATRDVELPQFDGSLAPLAEFLTEVREVAPEIRILIILDEFDDLPLDLYKRGEVGDAFFHTLRAIANQEGVAFILVGSEKMEPILSTQGQFLNKFNSHRIDYFDRERHWQDFADLVRRPTQDWLEITEPALVEIYQQTAGNPYFTKLICKSLASLMIDNHDSQATHHEVRIATQRALSEVSSPSFAHFWEDGIFEPRSRAEDITLQRRRLLIAIAGILRGEAIATKEHILAEGRHYGLPEEETKQQLDDFTRRQVLVQTTEGYRFKVPFFTTWLQERGISEILTLIVDQDAVLLQRTKELEAYVRAEEVADLVSAWGTYQDRPITEDVVRAWLRQFGDNSKQRLMFHLLQNLRFYSQARIRQKLREAQGIIFRDLVDRSGPRQVITDKRRRRSEELVSYIDDIGKRGPTYAKLYADENRVATANVVEPGSLAKILATRQGLETLVFLDDFLGTGNSAIKYFTQLNAQCGEILRRSEITIYFVAVTGFLAAKDRLEQHLAQLRLPINVQLCDPLDESDRCFHVSSRIFPDELTRNEALNLATLIGSKLVPNDPLGYGNVQSAVVFEYNCPNNTLPILWSSANGWRPLFKRL